MDYGRVNEQKAIEMAERKLGLKRISNKQQCFRDSNDRCKFPDALFPPQIPLEVKCSPNFNTIWALAASKKSYLLWSSQDGFEVNPDHSVYKQVQKQIELTNSSYGFLMVYIDDTQNEVVRVNRK